MITDAGVWHIDVPSLEALVRNQLFAQPDTGISATFEANAIVSDRDRSQILELIIRDLISNEANIEKLKGQSDLCVEHRYRLSRAGNTKQEAAPLN